MNGLPRYHTGDDELLVILLDAPNRWLVRNGLQSAITTTLRQALRKAHDFSSGVSFSGKIIKQPNDELVIEARQVLRLWDCLGYNDFAEVVNPQILGIALNPAA